MSKLAVYWIGDQPPDAKDWERIINERAEQAMGFGAVRIRNIGGRWWIEAARIGHVAFGMGWPPPDPGRPLDYRWHLTEALRKAGKPVIGRVSMDAPLSPEEVRAVSAAIDGFGSLDPQGNEVGFDWQPVSDLLKEIERLRADRNQ